MLLRFVECCSGLLDFFEGWRNIEGCHGMLRVFEECSLFGTLFLFFNKSRRKKRAMCKVLQQPSRAWVQRLTKLK